MITRKQYMDREATHAQYYGQFVTPEILAIVEREIGTERILASKDSDFNDIELADWDMLARFLSEILVVPIKAAGDTLSLSSVVCTAKQAARQIKAGAALKTSAALRASDTDFLRKP